MLHQLETQFQMFGSRSKKFLLLVKPIRAKIHGSLSLP